MTFWEPWVPQIGQRVRIRLSGECNADWQEAHAEPGFFGHVDAENGRTGVVAQCFCGPAFPCEDTAVLGHPYPVRTEPFEWRGTVWGGGHYAAIELEPLP